MPFKHRTISTTLLPLLLLLLVSTFAAAGGPQGPDERPSVWGYELPSDYLIRSFIQNGRVIDEVIAPGRPPDFYRAPAVDISQLTSAAGTTILPKVPAFDWCYGCSATSAAMIAGHYDNNRYPNMYAGPTNNGVCPLTNSAWGPGECPLSATHLNYDGLLTKGHVDDYWIRYLDPGPDPYIGNWAEHPWADCTADYMGTNQSKYGNVDASTTFYFYTNGGRLFDYTDCEPAQRDGCHGFRQFVESRGYSVAGNYSQYILGYRNNQEGFTFADFEDEIDAGRPVLIQVAGHTMVGFGYTSSTNTLYIHDTWDYSDHTMTWGATYAGLQHYGVTTLQIAAPPELSISGRVTCDGVGVPDVWVSCSNNTPSGVYTDANGYYELFVPNGWTGVVTPIHDGYSFLPQSVNFDWPVTDDSTDVDFTATLLHSITVISPNGGEQWLIGSTQSIRWSCYNPLGQNVIIDLWRNGEYVGNIGSAPDSALSFDWTISQSLQLSSGYRVRIGYVESSIRGTSDADFTITDKQIQVASPNGGETWTAGTYQTIRWTYSGNPGSYVKIELLRAGTVVSAITRSALMGSAGNGSYRWLIPSTQAGGSDYRVRVTSTTNAVYTDTSDSDFTITGPSITLTSPNGGEAWEIGTTKTITWTYIGSVGTYVKLELFQNGAWQTIASSALASSKAYNWPIPYSVTPNVNSRVRITSNTNPSISDTSEADFTFTPSSNFIEALEPDVPDTVLMAGQSTVITWNYGGDPGRYVKISLYSAGSLKSTIASSVAISNKAYTWRVPATLAERSDYRVRITSTSIAQLWDDGQSDFTVVQPPTAISLSVPNGGEKWTVGTSQTIRWTYTGRPGTYVKIELYKGGALSKRISSATSMGSYGAGSYRWTIPTTQTPGTDYRIKITSTTNSSYTDSSDADFEIAAIQSALTVTSPNGGEILARGHSQTITWSYTSYIGNYVKIELYKGGALNRTISVATSAGVGGAGSYRWTVPTAQPEAGDYKIKITSTSNSVHTDSSDNDFWIWDVPGSP